MASKEQARPTNPATYYHELMRPAILQILRAQGYHSCSPTVLDSVTELACRHMQVVAQSAASHAERNNEHPCDFTVVDLRMALEDCGSLSPVADVVAQAWREDEDTRGVDNFLRWAKGKKNAKIRKMAYATQQANAMPEDLDAPVMDYLSVLKKKHNKTDMDSKYAGTVLGKSLDHGDVMIEGGTATSIHDWAKQIREQQQRPAEPSPDSRPPSSGLSSLTDGDVEMMDLA